MKASSVEQQVQSGRWSVSDVGKLDVERQPNLIGPMFGCGQEKFLMPTTPRKITEAPTMACCPGAVAERTRPPAPKLGSAANGMDEVAGRIRRGSRDLMIYNPQGLMRKRD
jgi:hypothetical protein